MSQTKSKKLLLLLHAFPFDQRMWRLQLEGLSPYLRAIAVNIGGFGKKSDTPSPELHTSIAGMADEVARYLDRQKMYDPVILGGLSMGGYVALKFAQKYHARLDKLILANTRALPDSEEARTKRDTLRQRLADGEKEQVLNEHLKLMLMPDSPAEPEIRQIAFDQPTEVIRAALAAMRDREDATPWLPEITVPTLLIAGKEDKVIPVQEMSDMANKIPNAQFAQLDKAAHLSNVDQPKDFTDLIVTFIHSS